MMPLPHRVLPTKLRRFADREVIGSPLELHPNHPAVLEGHTMYESQVTRPETVERVLKSGEHNKKIGSMVVKGRWRGMPIFTLTLEERFTCPSSCRHWADCYGNKMRWSQRLVAGVALERRLEDELADLQDRHPDGFVVRLHVLGDFYDVAYVLKWLAWLTRYPALRVFGYTSWPPRSEIGRTIGRVRDAFWHRFAIRFSNQGQDERGAETVFPNVPQGTFADPSELKHKGIVCPAQTDATDCCGTCGLCWSTDKNILFLAH